MFEKEAEEYGLQQALWCTSDSGDLRDAFKDGAEFGYNKGLEAGRSKWHKVADGDLPPVRMVVFVSGYLGDMKDLHGFDEWDGEKWLNEDMPGFVRVAWCEIPRFKEKA